MKRNTRLWYILYVFDAKIFEIISTKDPGIVSNDVERNKNKQDFIDFIIDKSKLIENQPIIPFDNKKNRSKSFSGLDFYKYNPEDMKGYNRRLGTIRE